MTNIQSIIEKDFGSIRATIEPNDDREGVNCYLHNRIGGTSSLSCAEDTGFIDELDPNCCSAVPQRIIDAVYRWIDSEGFDY